MKTTFFVGLAALTLVGCSGSNRRISLGDRVISTQTPIQLDRHSLPIAVSRDGRHMLLAGAFPDLKKGKLSVIDVDSQRVLRTRTLTGGRDSWGTPIFTKNGEEVCVVTDKGYVAWNYITGVETPLPGDWPRAREFNWLDENGWNFDRSIAICYSREGDAKSGSAQFFQEEPGQIVLARGVTFPMEQKDRGGFDQFGSAWFGHGTSWSMVDRDGHLNRGLTKCPALVHDQTHDRGSLHLGATSQVMTYRDARSPVTCIWLTHDHAVPFTRKVEGKIVQVNEPYRAAVVFAGADVMAFGFLPGRDLIYVVSGFGCYLVPYETKPADPSKE